MQRTIVKRYSTAFKMKVVAEIESGELTVAQAQRRYDLGRGATVYNWLKTYGNHYKQAKVVRVERPGEVDRVRQLEKEKQQLESALAAAHLKILRLESTVEVLEEMGATPGKKSPARIHRAQPSKARRDEPASDRRAGLPGP